MRKRAFGLLLAVLLLISLQTASASSFLMAGYDGQDSNHNWETNVFFTRMEEKTGVSFTFDQYNDYKKWQNAKQKMFSSGVLPDVLFKAALSEAEQMAYGEEGLLIDLLPLLPTYAPNLWALLQQNPEWLAAITLPDGKVVALPVINQLPSQNAMWINQTWLDTLKLDAPTDFASLEKVLNAFLTDDPNQNGKNDEIPLSFIGPWDLKFLAHGFGLVANDYNIYVDEAGQVQFMPLQERFVNFLQTLASFYQQGLLDENGFTTADALRSLNDSDDDVIYGILFGPNPYNLLAVDLGEQYTMLEPLAYEGKQIYRDLFGPVKGGAFAITSACSDPGALLSWADLLYTQEGAIEAMAGIKDKDYTVDSEGLWDYAIDLQEESSYILYDLSIYDSGSMPWLFPVDFYAAYELDSLRSITQCLLDFRESLVSPFPYYYMLSEDQHTVIDPLQLALGKYIDESIAEFILGEIDVHNADDIQAFYNGLQERGVHEFIAFWQSVYDQQVIR